MLQGIDTVLRLWRGEAVRGRDGNGRDIDVRVYPRPVQGQPPIWLACTSSIDTFVQAGRMGANVLTALLRFGVEELEERIALYRRTRRESGHDPDAGRVTVMLHTYLDADEAAVHAASSEPLLEYLRSHLDFLGGSAAASTDRSGRMSEREREALLAHAFQRYSTTQALIGTPESCLRTVERLHRIGVNELACLVDFGVEFDAAMNGLRYLGELRALVSGSAAPVVV
jgi:natural product biosynthesis luciferase-like monooxygenase protein